MGSAEAARPAAPDAREPRRVDDLLGSKFDTEANLPAPNFQYRQGDLFDPLIGLSVIGPFDRQHGTAAFVGRNRTVRCAGDLRHRAAAALANFPEILCPTRAGAFRQLTE